MSGRAAIVRCSGPVEHEESAGCPRLRRREGLRVQGTELELRAVVEAETARDP